MNKTEQAEQLRLAAEIIETGHPFEVCRARHGEWFKPDPMIVFEWMPPEYEIRLALATPPDGRPLHNHHDLTAEQVGAGWRLLLPEEVDGRFVNGRDKCEWWSDGREWRSTDQEFEHNCSIDTIRVPLSVPWPEAPKPEPIFQLPPPPPGMQWHREDGWKEGDLPQGYRPLIAGEWRKNEDEWTYDDGNGWRLVANYGPEGEVGRGAAKHRTTRPLVFTHEGKEWTYHRPGDPMPCHGGSMVAVVFQDGNATNYLQIADGWSWGQHGDYATIIGWRYAEPQTKTVPLGPEDVPPGSVFRHKGDDGYIAPTSVFSGGIYSHDEVVFLLNFQHLMSEFQINRSIPLTGKWDANAWEQCSKEVPA